MELGGGATLRALLLEDQPKGVSEYSPSARQSGQRPTPLRKEGAVWCLVAFVAGLVVGACIGMFILALCAVAHDD